MPVPSVYPLSVERHAGFRIKPMNSFEFAAEFDIVSLLVNEFTRAAAYYPIVFLQHEGVFRPYVLTGINKGENLYVDANGRWQVQYIPAMVRRTPFILGKSSDNNTLAVCLDEASPLVSASEGLPLYDVQGNPAKLVEDVRKFLGELNQFVELTKQFCERLEGLGLLSSIEVGYKLDNGEEKRMSGCFSVDERKLNELSDEQYLKLRKSGDLPLIYAQLLSLTQTDRLVQFKKQRKG